MKKRVFVAFSLEDSLSLENQIWTSTQNDIALALEGIGAEEVVVYAAGDASNDIVFSIHTGDSK